MDLRCEICKENKCTTVVVAIENVYYTCPKCDPEGKIIRSSFYECPVCGEKHQIWPDPGQCGDCESFICKELYKCMFLVETDETLENGEPVFDTVCKICLFKGGYVLSDSKKADDDDDSIIYKKTVPNLEGEK